MKNSLEKRRGAAPGPDLARFFVRPPLRCCERGENPAGGPCGERAYWQRSDPAGIQFAYVCTQHRQLTDQPIAGATVFRRVRVCLEVTLHGVSEAPGAAEAEALARLETAIDQVGGVAMVLCVTSTVGRYEPSAVTPRARGAGEDA